MRRNSAMTRLLLARIGWGAWLFATSTLRCSGQRGKGARITKRRLQGNLQGARRLARLAEQQTSLQTSHYGNGQFDWVGIGP